MSRMIVYKLLRYQKCFPNLTSNRKGLYTSKINFKVTFQSRMFEYLSQAQKTNQNMTGKFAKQQTLLQEKESKGLLLPENMNLRDIFEMLELKIRADQGVVTVTKFYKQSMKSVLNKMQCEKVCKNDLIKLLFYIGLQKKTPQAHLLIRAVLLRIKDCLNDLTLEDSCILANATFKCSITNLDPTVIEHIRLTLCVNLQKAMDDSAILVCLTKSLRQLKCCDYELLEKLSHSCDKWAKNFTVKAHILALFAESKYYNQRVLEFLVGSSLEDLRNITSLQEPVSKYFDERPRAKDVARFLWAASALGWRLEPNDVEKIIWPQLQGRLSTEYRKQPAVLLDSLLSMCIMGHYSTDLMAWGISIETQQLLREQNKTQPWVKLKLLLAAAQAECPQLIAGFAYDGPLLPEQTVQRHLKQRAPLQRVLAVVHCLAPSLKLAPPKCHFQIPPLHIAGIIVSSLHVPASGRPKTLHFEVMDASVSLHGSSVPTGLMALKLRLLKSLGLLVITLEQAQLSQDDAVLFTWIEDQLCKHFS